MNKIPTTVNLGRLSRTQLETFMAHLQAELETCRAAIATMHMDDVETPGMVAHSVVVERLFKKIRARWEQGKPACNVSIDILEAIAVWQLIKIGQNDYTQNVILGINTTIHKQIQ